MFPGSARPPLTHNQAKSLCVIYIRCRFFLVKNGSLKQKKVNISTVLSPMSTRNIRDPSERQLWVFSKFIPCSLILLLWFFPQGFLLPGGMVVRCVCEAWESHDIRSESWQCFIGGAMRVSPSARPPWYKWPWKLICSSERLCWFRCTPPNRMYLCLFSLYLQHCVSSSSFNKTIN